MLEIVIYDFFKRKSLVLDGLNDTSKTGDQISDFFLSKFSPWLYILEVDNGKRHKKRNAVMSATEAKLPVRHLVAWTFREKRV